MKNKGIYIRISDTLLEHFDQALEKEGVSRSHILTEAIRKYIKKENQHMGIEGFLDGAGYGKEERCVFFVGVGMRQLADHYERKRAKGSADELFENTLDKYSKSINIKQYFDDLISRCDEEKVFLEDWIANGFQKNYSPDIEGMENQHKSYYLTVGWNQYSLYQKITHS